MHYRSRVVLLATALLFQALTSAPVQAETCLPTCVELDGRFLALVSSAATAQSLTQTTPELEIQVPPGSSSFTIGIFDGDSSGSGGRLAGWQLVLPASDHAPDCRDDRGRRVQRAQQRHRDRLSLVAVRATGLDGCGIHLRAGLGSL